MTNERRNTPPEHLLSLVGEWEIEATHQALPGDIIRDRASFERLGEGVFLIRRTRYDHPDFPECVSIIGCDDAGDLRRPGGGCAVQYYDVRGVTRRYQLDAEPGVWRYWRDEPGFAQRFTGSFSPDGGTIDGVLELNRAGTTWEPDLPATCRRVTESPS